MRRLRSGPFGGGCGRDEDALSRGTSGHVSSGSQPPRQGTRPSPPDGNATRAVWVSGSLGHVRTGCREQKQGQLLPGALATAGPEHGQREARYLPSLGAHTAGFWPSHGQGGSCCPEGPEGTRCKRPRGLQSGLSMPSVPVRGGGSAWRVCARAINTNYCRALLSPSLAG